MAAVLDLVFLFGMAGFLAVRSTDLIYGVPTWLVAFLAVALIGAMLAVASAVMAALVWRDGEWDLLGRVHYTVVVLELLAFVWWLNLWNLLGFRF